MSNETKGWVVFVLAALVLGFLFSFSGAMSRRDCDAPPESRNPLAAACIGPTVIAAFVLVVVFCVRFLTKEDERGIERIRRM